jgi:hypothetical protein
MRKYLTALALLGLGFSCSTFEDPPAEGSDLTCADGNDNDLDGLIDCADPSCAQSVSCQPLPERCFGGADEDLDGFIDCEDSDCDNDASCATPEDCNNGADDDQDGLIDCADPNCTNNAVCATGDCLPLAGVTVTPAEQDILDDTTTGTDLTAGTNTGLVQQCGLGSGGGKERVFSFTPANDGDLSLTLASDTDQGMYVRTTCGDPNSEIACTDEFLSTDESLVVAVSGGVPLFIFVDAFEDGTEGLFLLTTTLQ